MKIFLSYASEDKVAADRIARTLRNDQHEVFFSEDSLNVGDAYARKIRQDVEASELFIFLISPDSLKEGCFTLTELRFAEQKWKSPSGFVLPVEVKKTPYESVPAYLSTLTIWRAAGNLETELAAEVAKIAESRGGTRLPQSSRSYALAALGSLVLGGLIGYSHPLWACWLGLSGCGSGESMAVMVSVECIPDPNDTSSRNIPKSAYVMIEGAFTQNDVDAAVAQLNTFSSMASVRQINETTVRTRYKEIYKKRPPIGTWAVLSQLADGVKIDFPLPKLDPNQSARFFVEFDEAPVTGAVASADDTIVAAAGDTNAPVTGIRELANFALFEDGSTDEAPKNAPKITKVNLNLYQGKIDCWENSSP